MARGDRDTYLRGYRLDIDEAADAILSLAAPESGVLHPTHWRVDAPEGGSKALVDVHSATFDLACHAPPPIMVGRPDAAVEPIVRVVGTRYRLLIVGDRVDADDRPKRLLGVALHFRRHTGQDRRLVEQLA